MNATSTPQREKTGAQRRRTACGRLVARALLALGALCSAPAARADSPAARAEEPRPAGTSLDREQRREPAQYRGRRNYATVGETLVWIPRAALFPLFLVTELGVRRPIYAGAEWI